jgi:hypothetical protein
MPSYQALDILAEARQNPYLNEDDYREIRDQVFREDPAPNQLKKLVRDRSVPHPPGSRRTRRARARRGARSRPHAAIP